MIYEGKEYVEVTDGSGEIGDLIHVTAVRGDECDIWCFTVDNLYGIPGVDTVLSDGYEHLALGDDNYKRYRYVKDVEKTSVEVFKEGDEVKVIGPSTGGRVEFIGNKTVVLYVCNNGDIRVNEKGYMGDYRPEALELIHQATEGVISECGIEEGDYLVITGDSAGHTLRKNAVVVAVGINWEDCFEAVELNGDVDWTINYKDVRRPTEQELELIANDAINRAKKTSDCSVPIVSLKNRIDNQFAVMSELIIAKNENYGDSFSKQYQKYGMVSVEMRLNDKFMRLEQLVAGEKDKVGESIEDTLKDIIGYATLALIELEGEDSER